MSSRSLGTPEEPIALTVVEVSGYHNHLCGVPRVVEVSGYHNHLCGKLCRQTADFALNEKTLIIYRVTAMLHCIAHCLWK
ncbi:hypothetical protein EMWEY_00016060 [Eimeria maxima]|uniref:Uncharacterized protein n=1 Tax=Eimeria maxima TaxID=5804 RepID=U6LWC1_EIMMA|nr:hypothetical protein EMWEY_00016060 [Eimeria maxima]CDJ56257.1 hypothetical protein EMWEY_00016060 [Eimeria maxima]